MPSSVCKLSIVCPAYEEEEVLPRFHAELCAVLTTLRRDYDAEIIYVDDGSRDSTLAILRALAAADPRVRYLSLSRNFGHQAALTAGLEHATGDVVVSMDSDLQHPPELLPALLEKWKEGYEVVLTIREDDPRLGRFKRLTSRVFYQVMRVLSDTEVRMSASDFRLMSAKAVGALLQLPETHRFLRGMVNWVGFPTTALSFQPASRGGGVSKYTLRRMANFAIDALFSFSKAPLRLSLVLGAAVLGLGLFFAVFALGEALLFTTEDAGWHTVLVAVLVLSGCILCSLGLVGEYVGRVYDQVKARPLYLLKETSPARGLGRALRTEEAA
jgi:dolichol-phosphate mannosyltransferase